MASHLHGFDRQEGKAVMRQTLDPKLLYQLHVIFECGSLSAAADFLSVSQPTLSRNVTALETQTGRPLMVRGRNGVTLTEAGILLAEQGRKIGSDLKQADEILADLKTNSPQTVRIGMGPIVASAVMNEFVGREITSADMPPLHLEIGTVRQLIADLIHGRLDLAVMVTPPDMHVEHLRSVNVGDDYIGLFAGPDSPLAREGRLDLEHLRTARWLAIDVGFGTISSHQNMLKAIGLPTVPPMVQFNMNIPGLVHVLSQSDAVTFLPARISSAMLRRSGVTEIPLDQHAEQRQITIWHSADAELNPALVSFIRRCRAFLLNYLEN